MSAEGSSSSTLAVYDMNSLRLANVLHHCPSSLLIHLDESLRIFHQNSKQYKSVITLFLKNRIEIEGKSSHATKHSTTLIPRTTITNHISMESRWIKQGIYKFYIRATIYRDWLQVRGWANYGKLCEHGATRPPIDPTHTCLTASWTQKKKLE